MKKNCRKKQLGRNSEPGFPKQRDERCRDYDPEKWNVNPVTMMMNGAVIDQMKQKHVDIGKYGAAQSRPP